MSTGLKVETGQHTVLSAFCVFRRRSKQQIKQTRSERKDTFLQFRALQWEIWTLILSMF